MGKRAVDEPGGVRAERRAIVAGVASASLLAAAIYLGSDSLRTFDAALIGYATATVVLTFGVVYRYAMWIQQPPTRRYFVHGWRAFLSWRNFRRFPALVPRQLVSYLGFQLFLRERGRGRWLAHQAIFWGVVLATLDDVRAVVGVDPLHGRRGGPLRDARLGPEGVDVRAVHLVRRGSSSISSTSPPSS